MNERGHTSSDRASGSYKSHILTRCGQSDGLAVAGADTTAAKEINTSRDKHSGRSGNCPHCY